MDMISQKNENIQMTVTIDDCTFEDISVYELRSKDIMARMAAELNSIARRSYFEEQLYINRLKSLEK